MTDTDNQQLDTMTAEEPGDDGPRLTPTASHTQIPRNHHCFKPKAIVAYLDKVNML